MGRQQKKEVLYFNTGGNAYREFMILYGMSVEFKKKIMLHCFREVKCQQGVTIGVCIRYIML